MPTISAAFLTPTPHWRGWSEAIRPHCLQGKEALGMRARRVKLLIKNLLYQDNSSTAQ